MKDSAQCLCSVVGDKFRPINCHLSAQHKPIGPILRDFVGTSNRLVGPLTVGSFYKPIGPILNHSLRTYPTNMRQEIGNNLFT